MPDFPPAPADRPLPDRERRRRELVALIRIETEEGQPRLAPVLPLQRPDTGQGDDTPMSDMAYPAFGDILEAPVTPGTGTASRPARRRTWTVFAATAAAVAVIGGAALMVGGHSGSGGTVVRQVGPAAPGAHGHAPSAAGPVLNGVPLATAQSELTSCLKTAADTNGTKLLAAPAAYRIEIAQPGLYRALEDGLATYLVGQEPTHGQLVLCSVPKDAKNPNGKELWAGAKFPAAGPAAKTVTLEFQRGGVGTPTLSGKGASVYANTLAGHYGKDVTRITVQYPGGKAQQAELGGGVWFLQSRLTTREAQSHAPVVRGYDATGKQVFTTAH